ncbi:MAG TPA: ABC transporter permease [Chitinophagaceae bacterium]|nr:ABC transporter permease [Chitinophagaceae bacterium]
MRININKTYSLINIFGLALGLTGVIIITLFLHYEFNYDTWHPQLQRVYRLEALNNNSSAGAEDEWNDICDARVAFALRGQLPAAQAVTTIQRPWSKQLAMEAGGKSFMQQSVLSCDSSFFNVFPYTFLSGNALAFSQPNSTVLTRETALTFFNTVNAAGRVINIKRYDADKPHPYTVAGVIATPASPSIMSFTALQHEAYMDKAPEYAGEHSPVKIFMLVRPNTAMQQTAQAAERIYNATLDAWAAQRNQLHLSARNKRHEHGIQLQSLRDAHIHAIGEKSLPEKMAPLIALSVLLLIIGIVNFTNLSIAQASYRAKEVVIRKISGAGRTRLTWRFLWQATIKCCAAFLLAGVFAFLLMPVFNSVFNISITSVSSISVTSFVITVVTILAVTILLSGLYPAVYIAGYKPLKVLRGDVSRSAGKFSLRNVLVVLQFAIAIIFMISLGIMGRQLNYMAHADLGFKPQGLIHIQASYNPQLAERIKNIPGVLYAGETSQTMGEADNMKINVFYNGDSARVNFVGIGYETMQTMHVKLQEGRLFSREHGADSINTIIVNSTAAKMMGGGAVGKWIYLGSYKYKQQIVGVIDDYHYQGFDKAIGPTVYTINGNYGVPDRNGILVNAGSNIKAVLPRIERLWSEYYAGYPFQYSFVDDEFNSLLIQYRRMQQVFNAFAVIAVLLSLTGLFALTTYMVQQRNKEIGIRKILGATVASILQKFNKNYLLLILVANIIAWPVAIMLSDAWLNGFVYRINIPLLPFAAAMGISLLLAAITVSIQVWRAAAANPVKVLRQE